MANPHSEVIGGEEENFAAMLEESFKGKGTTKGGELKGFGHGSAATVGGR